VKDERVLVELGRRPNANTSRFGQLRKWTTINKINPIRTTFI